MAVIRGSRRWLFGLLLLICLPLIAGVLPEDRTDALFHYYKGGGVEIKGPSIQARKQLGDATSVSGHYYVDSISSASIDVVTQASQYTEKRTEYGVNADYIHKKSSMSAGYTTSEESDYQAKTAHFSISQDVFSDLTTITMGFSRGWDVVGKSIDPNYSRDVDRRSYQLGISQILTKNNILDFGLEVITDEGLLNNPYRSYRYIDGASYLWAFEKYPNTRTSNAVAIRALSYLPYRAAVRGEYRRFNDTWGITANTYDLRYIHPLQSGLTLETRFRHYNQTAADFYSDLFPYQDAQNYLARDKELSTFSSNSIGLTANYEIPKRWIGFIDRGTINFAFDYIWFEYDDFRDVRTTSVTPGSESLYAFSAKVMQFYITAWY